MKERKTDKVYYSHFELDYGSVKKKAFITTAIVKRTDGKIYYNIALCSPRDQFCRQTGRQTSWSKLLGEPILLCQDGQQSTFDLCEMVVVKSVSDNLPSWLRKIKKITIRAKTRKKDLEKREIRQATIIEKN